MNTLHPNKTRSQVSVAINSGFFWSDNKELEFEKKTIVNGLPIIERHKGIILYPTPDHELKQKYNLTECFPIKECQYCKPAPNKCICVEGSVIDPVCPECGKKLFNEDL